MSQPDYPHERHETQLSTDRAPPVQEKAALDAKKSDKAECILDSNQKPVTPTPAIPIKEEIKKIGNFIVGK